MPTQARTCEYERCYNIFLVTSTSPHKRFCCKKCGNRWRLRRWRSNNPDKARAAALRMRVYRLKNSERIRERRRERYLCDKEKYCDQQQRYTLRNHEKELERGRRYRLANPEKVRESKRRRREKTNIQQRQRYQALRAIARAALALGFIQPGDLL